MLRLKFSALNPKEEILKKFSQDIEDITIEKPPSPIIFTVTLKSGASADKVAHELRNQKISYHLKPEIEIVESDKLYAEHPETDWSVGCYVKNDSNATLPKIYQDGIDAETFAHLLRKRLEKKNLGNSNDVIEISDESDGLSDDDKEDEDQTQSFVEDLLILSKAQSQLNEKDSSVSENNNYDESMR